MLMPEGWSYGDISTSMTSEHQARVSATGLLVGKFIELSSGNKEPIIESINQLMRGDADLIGGVTLTLVNMLAMYFSDNGQNLIPFKDLCDFLVKILADDTPTVQRIIH
jgi:hypothetical protein